MIDWAIQNDPDNVTEEILQKIHEVAGLLGDFLSEKRPSDKGVEGKNICRWANRRTNIINIGKKYCILYKHFNFVFADAEGAGAEDDAGAGAEDGQLEEKKAASVEEVGETVVEEEGKHISRILLQLGFACEMNMCNSWRRYNWWGWKWRWIY